MKQPAKFAVSRREWLLGATAATALMPVPLTPVSAKPRFDDLKKHLPDLI